MSEQVKQLVAVTRQPALSAGVDLVLARLTEVETRQVRGSLAEARAHCLTQGAPDILLVEVENPQTLAADLAALAECCPPQMRLVLLGERGDVTLFRWLISVGVDDYYPAPLDPDALRTGLLRLLGVPLATSLRKGRVICVVGAAGGVGTSTVAANLAMALADRHHRQVALLDLNLHHSRHPILLGSDYAPPGEQWWQATERLDGTLLAHTAHQLGPRLFLFYDEGQELVLGAEQLAAAVNVMAEHYSTLIIDVPDLRSHALQALLQQADVAIWLHDFSLGALRLLGQFPQGGPAQRRLLVGNHCRGKEGRVPAQALERVCGQPHAAVLPYDHGAFVRAERAGQPLIQQKSKLARALTSLAAELVGAQVAGLARGGRR
ncbi:TPA: P-loop NTPase [Aeromonas hydrophila]|uniref:AAA family ATPase n=1 Tax=Aeromonas hydrophila TaxID=644 RepID=UPI000C31D5E2|nr:P-loop NTPase [Aeromonas hydrophila]PKD23519.1 flp pilus assembly protein FlpE [Aeromonas hydrophila]WRK90263.1 P-loop NTPase [Aeromonas hydrophila]HAT2711707.1 P-loop NTPase [Aeromonas hydrophila]